MSPTQRSLDEARIKDLRARAKEKRELAAGIHKRDRRALIADWLNKEANKDEAEANLIEKLQ